ncbi:MAG: NUDIX hydrolase [Eggerthella lenta]
MLYEAPERTHGAGAVNITQADCWWWRNVWPCTRRPASSTSSQGASSSSTAPHRDRRPTSASPPTSASLDFARAPPIAPKNRAFHASRSQLSNIRQVSDGWIKNTCWPTYARQLDVRIRKRVAQSLDAYRAELEGNARGERPVADAVCIVPQTADGKLLLIREFRYPLNSWCIAFPAGLMEPGEDLATCVDRELREETGYALRADADAPALDPLPQAGYSSTGLTDETVHVVFAQVEKVADAQPEPAEFIEPFLLPIADVPRFLAENETPIGTRAQLVLEAFARRR